MSPRRGTRSTRLAVMVIVLLFGGCSRHRDAISRAESPHSTDFIQLSPLGCYGPCPVYNLYIYGDGRVRYYGKEYVAVVGAQEWTISTTSIARLFEECNRIDFFDLKDVYDRIQHGGGSYETSVDQPEFLLSAFVNGRLKQVIDSYGTPAAVVEFRHLIVALSDVTSRLGNREPFMEQFMHRQDQ